MAVIANRRVDLLPGWTFQPGERCPETLWKELGKAKQRVLLSGRFFLVQHGKKAEAVPAAVFNKDAADRFQAAQQEAVEAPKRKIVVWPEYEKQPDTSPSLRELAGVRDTVGQTPPFRHPLACGHPGCDYVATSKQALGGHRKKHSRVLQEA